ncbi:MAG: DUF6624 domain-containing protein [Bacteroidota bacterium]
MLLLLTFSCRQAEAVDQHTTPTIDTTALVAEIEQMYLVDQAVQSAHKAGESARTRDSLYTAQDSIFRAHTPKLERILLAHGFPSFDLVGPDISKKYWILVQHCDHAPEFQIEVLGKMKVALDSKQANPSDYAYLTDRVAMNADQPLVYGTQLQYSEDFWVSPLPTRDSTLLDERRRAMGLESIETYLNEVMKMHFEMNEAVYIERGMDGPNRY